MAPRPIRFVYLTGLRRESLGGARLTGSWDSQGRYSDRWSIQDMEPFVAEDGCPAFHATVDIDDAGDRRTFHWGVYVDGPAGANLWGIPTEVEDHASGERYRSFDVDSVGEEERYHLTYCRRLGANKLVLPDGSAAISFSVWAPSAQAVEVVTGDPGSGYIADSGKGVTSPPGAFPMTKEAAGIWHTDRTPSAGLSSFEEWNHQPYMFKITNEQGPGSVPDRSVLPMPDRRGPGEPGSPRR